jgi:hypothetical protein
MLTIFSAVILVGILAFKKIIIQIYLTFFYLTMTRQNCSFLSFEKLI